MDIDMMVKIAERNLKKAKTSLFNNCNRKGITKQELDNLSNNVEYTQFVYDLISKRMV